MVATEDDLPAVDWGSLQHAYGLAVDIPILLARARTDTRRFPVRTVYFSGAALTEGVEVHRIDGVPVRVYSAAKTVVDCFKYRNKIGSEIALEALRDYLKMHRRDADSLWRFAKICRVSNIMRPYLHKGRDRCAPEPHALRDVAHTRGAAELRQIARPGDAEMAHRLERFSFQRYRHHGPVSR